MLPWRRGKRELYRTLMSTRAPCSVTLFIVHKRSLAHKTDHGEHGVQRVNHIYELRGFGIRQLPYGRTSHIIFIAISLMAEENVKEIISVPLGVIAGHSKH
jgi:hypothetical protein